MWMILAILMIVFVSGLSIGFLLERAVWERMIRQCLNAIDAFLRARRDGAMDPTAADDCRRPHAP